MKGESMLAEKTLCTGCGSCTIICPYHCIDMEEDEEGFLYPNVNSQKCVSCGLCEQSCPVLTNKGVQPICRTESFAVQNKDENIRRKSSSGGVFIDLALSILGQGGVVCAAKYSKDFDVIHSIATTKEELLDYCGAKYAQSKIGQCFIYIKKMLHQGGKILFVGTPCQVAGLSAFLKRPYDNLVLVDMICHGVPSPLVWRKYLEERKQRDANGAELVAVNLRDKSTGWSRYGYSVRFDYQDGKVYSAHQDKDSFMQGFVSNLYLRPSCSNCKFKGVERISDITIGDYWGVWSQYPEFDDNMGTSLVMVHSEKGKKIWKNIQNDFRVLEISNEEAIQYNPSATKSSSFSYQRASFYRGLRRGEMVSDLVQTCLSKQNDQKVTNVQWILNKLFHRVRGDVDE
ncbi:Coenzyme F420 hydrogenase/dehydrogenase, beta subunit C-terminal domain [Fusibacillus kribbianus]|uniref:Coenzyme F420 hydrogenase/dehydrogenase, beta subunit C-terminal domain n=1 Tax=Fusibacillus kribbianus TaxID=3044208 RepID=A0AAP4BA86_9FIRM|nr:Coenzyme F420 hydrogenase/dehydrogenase, beta subunit C-terminal domain [Ruminococcus sp. YH-rum2234]MDI9241553.1 Coenzyme F420 hydrogenase/dehydrogenase, beta subunit C-terminal domain [Ruminococcus sp. YH-rum2234]